VLASSPARRDALHTAEGKAGTPHLRVRLGLSDDDGDGSPAHESADASLAGDGANANEALPVDRSDCARVDGVHRDSGDGRVPKLHENVRARGAQSGGATLR
jgi:hypothetical protein